MDDAKLVLIIGDDAWFWVLNEGIWEGWVEYAAQPAKRMPSNDSVSTESVLALMRLRVECAATHA
jgi:hypothetical protein